MRLQCIQFTDMDIGQRLEQFVLYKIKKSKVEFAEQIGWDKQYLNGLIKGKSFGLKPVETLLQKFPELNARWLILGEGSMLSGEYAEGARKRIRNRIAILEKMEDLIPYMAKEQLLEVSYGNMRLSDEEIKKLEDKAKSGTQISTHNL